jgi:hypothetical protein
MFVAGSGVGERAYRIRQNWALRRGPLLLVLVTVTVTVTVLVLVTGNGNGNQEGDAAEQQPAPRPARCCSPVPAPQRIPMDSSMPNCVAHDPRSPASLGPCPLAPFASEAGPPPHGPLLGPLHQRPAETRSMSYRQPLEHVQPPAVP